MNIYYLYIILFFTYFINTYTYIFPYLNNTPLTLKNNSINNNHYMKLKNIRKKQLMPLYIRGGNSYNEFDEITFNIENIRYVYYLYNMDLALVLYKNFDYQYVKNKKIVKNLQKKYYTNFSIISYRYMNFLNRTTFPEY